MLRKQQKPEKVKQTSTASKTKSISRFRIEKLEERIAPCHPMGRAFDCERSGGNSHFCSC
jgi:hypothetical protein